jgi:DNA-binding NtrC family response regulator
MGKTAINALVVDDDGIWRDLLRKLVSKYYRNVDEADSFEQGLSLINASPDRYDLLVADIRLDEAAAENVKGLDLIQEFVKAGLHAKSIAITCHPSAETKKRAESLGARYFVKGSFSRQAMWDVLSEFIEEEVDAEVVGKEEPCCASLACAF